MVNYLDQKLITVDGFWKVSERAEYTLVEYKKILHAP